MESVLTTFQPEQRDSYGQYSILNGHIHVFPFTIPLFGNIRLTTAHILPNSQDFSLMMWISDAPLDGLELREGFGHYKPIRRAIQYTIYDSFLKSSETDDRLFLKSGVTYYVNVKNLQNRNNAYELAFDDQAQAAPPTP